MSNLKVKEAVVAEIKEKLKKAQVAILTDYRGLNVSDITELRRQLREEGIEYRVLKNTLTKRAAAELGYEGLEEFLEGPTAIAFSYDDPVGPAKILSKFAKGNDKLKLKAGILEDALISQEKIVFLADLPSKEVLLAQVAGTFASPLTSFASVLQANLRNFVYVLDAVRQEKEKSA